MEASGGDDDDDGSGGGRLKRVRRGTRTTIRRLRNSIGALLGTTGSADDPERIRQNLCAPCRMYLQHLQHLEPCHLHSIVEVGHARCVGALVKAGVDLEAATPAYRSLLLCAIYNGQQVAAKILLKAGASINVRSRSKKTPLALAIREGLPEVVAALLELGADPEETTSGGQTPLTQACGLGTVQVVKELVKRGARPPDNALIIAARYNQPEVGSFLLGIGYDWASEVDGVTALEVACAYGQPKVVQAFLNGGGKERQWRVLQKALVKACEKGHAGCATLLVDEGWPKRERSANSEATPLHAACRYGHEACVTMLLHNGADVDVLDHEDRTPLEVARQHGHKGCVKIIQRVENSLWHRKGFGISE